MVLGTSEQFKLKVKDSEAFSTFTMLCHHHLCLAEVFLGPERKP